MGLRSEALLTNNGVVGRSIPEDCETAIELHSKGWNRHLTEARLIVAVSVTRIACQRASAEDLEALAANVASSLDAVKRGDLDERTKINLEFHRLLARATKNPVLIIITDALVQIQQQMLEVLPPAPNSAVMPSRERLLTYLQNRDQDMAAQEMESNLRALQQHYLEERIAAPKVAKPV